MVCAAVGPAPTLPRLGADAELLGPAARLEADPASEPRASSSRCSRRGSGSALSPRRRATASAAGGQPTRGRSSARTRRFSRRRSSCGNCFPSSCRGSRCAAGRLPSSRRSWGSRSAVATLVKMIEDNEFQTIWAWIGLALALAIMLVALIRVRYRWGIRGRDRPTGCSTAPSRRRAAPARHPRDARAAAVASPAILGGQHTGATRSRRGRFSGRAASRGRRSAS